MTKDQIEAAGVMAVAIGLGLLATVLLTAAAGAGILLVVVGVYLIAEANT